MAKKIDISHIAAYLFIASLIAAVIAGLAVGLADIEQSIRTWISVLFVVLGVVIGACMITSKKIEEEIYVILLVTVALLVASQMGVFAKTGTTAGAAIDNIVTYIAMFSAAAIIVLAIRTITHFHVSKIR